ncbi:hypothetical protein LOK49_LG12G02378 [Camellia lanceoleosa]|uniref:Uncharacterized protein n=1 Tax=Camellia lanceoleosa TaxID=1840588 RepID=A0ACC0FUK2_9ERIC|nr:hypothetical protein LOK49_LG12G02378 [Camellia lanceoleosa]
MPCLAWQDWISLVMDLYKIGEFYLMNNRFIVLIIIWERNWCKTCWYFILQIAFSCHCGIVTTLTMYRLCLGRILELRVGVDILMNMVFFLHWGVQGVMPVH